MKTACGRGHLAGDIVKRLLDDFPVGRLAGHLPGVQVDAGRYARFPAQPFCLEFQVPVQYVALGLVQPRFSRKNHEYTFKRFTRL